MGVGSGSLRWIALGTRCTWDVRPGVVRARRPLLLTINLRPLAPPPCRHYVTRARYCFGNSVSTFLDSFFAVSLLENALNA